MLLNLRVLKRIVRKHQQQDSICSITTAGSNWLFMKTSKPFSRTRTKSSHHPYRWSPFFVTLRLITYHVFFKTVLLQYNHKHWFLISFSLWDFNLNLKPKWITKARFLDASRLCLRWHLFGSDSWLDHIWFGSKQMWDHLFSIFQKSNSRVSWSGATVLECYLYTLMGIKILRVRLRRVSWDRSQTTISFYISKV